MPANTMNQLARFPGSDRNDLGEVQVKARRVGECGLHGAEYQRVLNDLAKGGGAGDQAAGALGAAAGEVVGAWCGGVHVARQFCAHFVHDFWRNEAINHDHTVGGEHGFDVF